MNKTVHQSPSQKKQSHGREQALLQKCAIATEILRILFQVQGVNGVHRPRGQRNERDDREDARQGDQPEEHTEDNRERLPEPVQHVAQLVAIPRRVRLPQLRPQ